MHEVSKAINNLDTIKGGIDAKICGGSGGASTDGNDTSGKCIGKSSLSGTNAAGGSSSSGNNVGLWLATSPTNEVPSKFLDGTKLSEVEHTSKRITQDISKLDRAEKGVVSSAFAKAHEGAEIVEIRSISTTSVMVNACYDVLAEGLPVSPYTALDV